MAEIWSTTLTNRLRFYINDIASPQAFTNFQLRTYIAIAAVAVVSEIATGKTWTIDTDAPSISPDPTTDTSISIGIANLFIMKAACIIAGGELRKDTTKFGIKIRDHLTAYDGSGGMAARTQIVQNFCKSYEDAKHEWELGNVAAGRAVVGPFTYADNPSYANKFALDWSGDRTRVR